MKTATQLQALLAHAAVTLRGASQQAPGSGPGIPDDKAQQWTQALHARWPAACAALLVGSIAGAQGARSLFTSAAVTPATPQEGGKSYAAFGAQLFPQPLAQCQFQTLPLATQLAMTASEGPAASLVSASQSLGMSALHEQRQSYRGPGGGMVRATLAPGGGGARGAATRATISLTQAAAEMEDVEYHGPTTTSSSISTSGTTPVGGAAHVSSASSGSSPGKAGARRGGGGVAQVTLDASIRR
jgi:hypothetical protein